MGVNDNEDKWLDEWVQRHQLRQDLKEDALHRRNEEARNGPYVAETAVHVLGYGIGVMLSYGIFVFLCFASMIFALWLMIMILF